MSQKLEDLLNLALETSEDVRRQTDTLNVGFDEETQSWELIVKYHGSLDALKLLDIRIEYLIAGYAILTVPENLVERVAELSEIEYVEKPKRYYYSVSGPTDGFCFPLVTMREPYLRGRGTLIAVLDSGIAYQRSDFRKRNGDTRIRFLWDQTLVPDENMPDPAPPEGYAEGVEFTETQINLALQASTEQERFALVPSVDVSGHGTAVAGIAAGYPEDGSYMGAAPLPRPRHSSRLPPLWKIASAMPQLW